MCFGNKQPSAPINKPDYGVDDMDKNMSVTTTKGKPVDEEAKKSGSATQSNPIKM